MKRLKEIFEYAADFVDEMNLPDNLVPVVFKMVVEHLMALPVIEKDIILEGKDDG